MILCKGVVLLLLACLAYSGSGHRRTKRTFSFLQASSEPKKTFPIYKVHRYTGLYITPIHPQQQGDNYLDHGVPQQTGEPPSILQLPENNYDGHDESSSTNSGLGTLSSLLPLGTGLISGAFGLSTGSSGNSQNFDDRIGFASKKNFIKSIPSRKKELVTSAVSGVVNSFVNKGLAAKGLVKGAFSGPKTSIVTNGVYTLVPIEYPKHQSFWSKVPIIRHFVKGTEIPLELPDVNLPHLPQFVAIEAPPDLPLINIPGHYKFPYKSGAYVKIKIPNKRYEIPSTSYGVPADPVPVPEPPFEPDVIPLGEPEEPTTSEPAVVTPETTTKSYPYPPAKPDVSPHPEYLPPQQEYVPPPPQTYPYPPEQPDTPEYIPPRPQYVTPPQEFIPPPPPELPEQPPTNFEVLPYPPSKPYVPSFPYPPETYPYPPSNYYQEASPSEQVIVKAEPEHPVYHHTEEPDTKQGADNYHEQQNHQEQKPDINEDRGETDKKEDNTELSKEE